LDITVFNDFIEKNTPKSMQFLKNTQNDT